MKLIPKFPDTSKNIGTRLKTIHLIWICEIFEHIIKFNIRLDVSLNWTFFSFRIVYSSFIYLFYLISLWNSNSIFHIIEVSRFTFVLFYF